MYRNTYHIHTKIRQLEVSDKVLLLLLKFIAGTTGSVTRAEGACDHHYFHSFYFRDLRCLLYSIFTLILPSFIFLQLFLLPLIRTAQSSELQADTNRRAR